MDQSLIELSNHLGFSWTLHNFSHAVQKILKFILDDDDWPYDLLYLVLGPKVKILHSVRKSLKKSQFHNIASVL